MLPEKWEASNLGGLVREWMTRTVAHETGSYRAQARGGNGSRLPPPALPSEHSSRSGTRNVRQASRLRSPPSSGPMDLPGPSACVGRDPQSHKAKGVLTGARVTNDIDPLGRKAGDLVVRGWLSAAPGSCSESHGNSGLGNKAGPRVAPGGSRRAGNGRRLFPARGYAVLPLT